jgi:hypothetical protein
MLKVSHRSVWPATPVIDAGTPELVAAGQARDLALSAAVMAELPKAQQSDIVAGHGGVVPAQGRAGTPGCGSISPRPVTAWTDAE